MADEQLWIERILAGEQHYFSFLVSRYERMAYTIAIRILENKEEAEEVVQDSFVKAYRALSDFQFESKFSTWFYKIVYRTALTAHRKQLFMERMDDIKQDQITTDEIDSASSLLEREDRKEVVRAVLQMLPKDESLLLTLFYFEECSIEEIHQITELTHSNIKVKLFRARKRFYEIIRKKMKQEISEI